MRRPSNPAAVSACRTSSADSARISSMHSCAAGSECCPLVSHRPAPSSAAAAASVGDPPDATRGVFVEQAALNQAQADKLQPRLPPDRPRVQVFEVGWHQLVFQRGTDGIDDLPVGSPSARGDEST